ncbi:dolichol-phosphate mannosyltransferase subunit 3 [Galendromus occidentalis]|uniref:Dolichol-phosphate mannosyltransferase subunit 3 n=1 Tax=Galendromus occidentalis TaxID=34638 RepID=A0AAJ6VX15_9ACAR|nr:dolichol-phosphate mannosyltransferase subunit 3 [Galendromus occidentalis]
MTKLLQWVVASGVVAAIWGAVLSQYWFKLTESQERQVLLFPIYFMALFALFAGTVIMWRVFSFNNCDTAASELRQEIQDAKIDLEARGFVMHYDDDEEDDDDYDEENEDDQ